MRIENMKRAWFEFGDQYDQLHTIAMQGQLQDRVQAEQDITCYVTLQRHYDKVHACAKHALNNAKAGKKGGEERSYPEGQG